MIEPAILQPRPSLLLSVVGGIVATILLMALTFLSPVLGFPFFDIPRITGGMFVRDPNVAFWLGTAIFFFGGAIGWPIVFNVAYAFLPGRDVGAVGAAVKGSIYGVILWVISGVALPLGVMFNHFSSESLGHPGAFGFGAGMLGAIGLFGGHLLYGVALALIISMAQGMKPLDALGWASHDRADVRDIALSQPTHPGHLEQPPAWKSKTTEELSSSSML